MNTKSRVTDRNGYIRIMAIAITAGTGCPQPYKTRRESLRLRQLKREAAKYGIGARQFKRVYATLASW